MVFLFLRVFLDFSVICFGFLCDLLDFSLSKVIMVVVELESGGWILLENKLAFREKGSGGGRGMVV